MVGAGKSSAPVKHGFYRAPARPLTTIDEIFADLAERQARLSAYIDRHWSTLSRRNLVALLRLHSQTAGKLASLLRHQHALDEKAADDGFADAMARALRQVGKELGISLCPPLQPPTP